MELDQFLNILNDAVKGVTVPDFYGNIVIHFANEQPSQVEINRKIKIKDLTGILKK